MKTKSLVFVLFVVSIISTITCRFYQTGNPSENMSLFFSSEFFCFVISLVCYILMGIIVRFSYKNQGKVDEIFNIGKNYVAAIVSCALGVSVTINGVMILIKYINGFRSFSPLFEGLFAILAGPAFVLAGVCYASGKNFFKNDELVALAPVAWGASRTINIFLRYNMVSNVAWNLSDVLATIFISLFLLNQAKCIAQREELKKCSKMRLYGYSAAMFILIYTTRTIVTKGKDFLCLPPDNTGIVGVISSVWIIDVLVAFYILSVVTGMDIAYKKGLESV